MTVDFSMMVSFHQKYMVLHDLISETTQLYTKYWSEYLTSKPGTNTSNVMMAELEALVQTGFQIAVNCERIEETLRVLTALSPNNVSGLVLYALFQKFVMDDEFAAFESSLQYSHLTLLS